MKVLVAARLSVLNDGETGLDSQEREVIQWAEQHGHEVVGIAADHKTGKSALWDRPNLRPWVTEPAMLAQYDAIVALKVDRLTRADDEGVDAMKQWARDHHKQLLISSAEVRFPSEGMEGAMWDMYIRMAHAEWLAIRERYRRMQDHKHEANSLVGRNPWGYEVASDHGIKTLAPTAEGKVWVPRVFAWITEGRTLRSVGEELEANGIRSGAPDGCWPEQRVAVMIKCPTYAGRRVRAGRAALPVEALVTQAVQDQAVAMLAQRARLGATGSTQPKALLAKLKCGHPDCPGAGTWPMYRVKRSYYRCNGTAPGHKGCSAPMIATVALDSLVLNATEYWESREHVTQAYVPGNDAGVRLEALRGEMADAMRIAPADKIAAVAADYAERIKALEDEGSVAPHWQTVKSGLTEGEYLRTLDLDGQREFLGRMAIAAWRVGPVIQVTVDGALARKGGRSGFADLQEEG
jgi:DNA invertase Pin-like site-specific DNA recombinase